ncbi:MAG: radical SAM protein [bacterium]
MKVYSAPQRVTLNITNRCNLDCLYCAVSSTKNAPGDLSLEEWKRVIDEMAGIKVFHIKFSGGEPFISPDFGAILEYIFHLHFRISINTNGTLLDEDIISLISRSGRLDHIQVSLDGADALVHDLIRGKETFDKIMEGLPLLQKWSVPFSFFVVVSKNNKDHLREIVALAKDTAAFQVSFSPLLPQGSALGHLDDLFLSFEERKSVEQRLRELKREFPNLVGGSYIQGIRMMDAISGMDMSHLISGESNRISSCGGSIKECSIRPDGEVIPCDRLWDYPVGNVREATLQSIWLDSDGFRHFRRRYTRTMDSFNECKGCRYITMCKGGCPAIPFNMGKGIEGWDPESCYKVFTGEKRGYIRLPC